jgi:hypothetical protein
MRKKKLILMAIAITVALVAAFPVLAGGMNYAKVWETLGGSRWNGYVQIQACYNDGGRHAKQGYHRFTREAGPPLDTG